MEKVEITPENVDELVELHTDEWLPAQKISELFKYLAPQTIRTWSKEGDIRRRETGKSGRKAPHYEYNVCDAIVARRRRKRIKPFLRRMVGGIELFRCNRCEWWTGRGGFYKNTVPSPHGLLTTCIDCHLEAGNANRNRSPIELAKRAEAARQRRAERQQQVKKAAAFKPADRIDAKRIIEIIDRRFPDKQQYNDREVCALAGVHEEVIQTIRRRAKEGGNSDLGMVDDLFSGLDWNDDLSVIHDELERDRPAWGPHGQPYCSMCLRSNRTYMARGLCSTCYKHRNEPDYRPMAESAWAMRYSQCVDCGTNEKKHIANGRCGRCDSRWRKAKG